MNTRRHYAHVLARVATVAALLFSGASRAEVIDIDTAELSKLSAAGIPVVDVRTPGEWQESGVVPGSRLITLFDERGQADPDWLAKLRAVAGPEQPVAIICRSGNRSRVAAQMASQQAGYAKVYNVRGGIRAWAGEQRPLAPAATAVASCPAGKRC